MTPALDPAAVERAARAPGWCPDCGVSADDPCASRSGRDHRARTLYAMGRDDALAAARAGDDTTAEHPRCEHGIALADLCAAAETWAERQYGEDGPAEAAEPEVGARFTLPNALIRSVQDVVWRVTSVTPDLIRYIRDDDPRVGKRPITMPRSEWAEVAPVPSSADDLRAQRETLLRQLAEAHDSRADAIARAEAAEREVAKREADYVYALGERDALAREVADLRARIEREADALGALAKQAEGLDFDPAQKARGIAYRLAERSIRALAGSGEQPGEGFVSSTGHRWPCTRFYVTATDRDPCTCRPAPVVPDSPDLRGEVKAIIRAVGRRGTGGPDDDEATDAVLAVVRPTVTAEQIWDEGVEHAFQGMVVRQSRSDVLRLNPYRAVVRPDERPAPLPEHDPDGVHNSPSMPALDPDRWEEQLRAERAQALRDAADVLRADAAETYWRDDSPFHAQGRSWSGTHASWLLERAARIEHDAPTTGGAS